MVRTASRATLAVRMIGLGVVAALGLAGCAAGAPSGDGPVTLKLWSWADGETYVKDLASKFNDEHDDIKVEVTVIPSHDFQQKLGTAVANGDGPDIAVLDNVLAPYFMANGAFTDLTDRAKALPYFDDLNAPRMVQSSYQDKVYALPFVADSSALFYNKDLFTKAGLDPNSPPKTWDEFAAAANAISALGPEYTGYHFSAGCGGCSVFTFAPMVWASGGDVLDLSTDEANPEATFDDPAVVSTVKMLHDLYKSGGMTSESQVDSGADWGGHFDAGQLGMVIVGTNYLAQITQQNVGFEVGLTPIPGQQAGQSAAFAGGDLLAIPTTAKHVDAAWEFLNWATDEEAQTAVADGGYTSIRTDLYDKLYGSKGPEYEVLTASALNGKAPYSVQENALFNDANGPLVGLMQSGVFGDDVDAAIAAAQKTADQIVAQGVN